MSDSDDFFDSGPSPADNKSSNKQYEFGSGSKVRPSHSDGVPKHSSHGEERGKSSVGYSEDQIEVMESRGSKLYERSSSYPERDSQEYGDTKKVEWSDGSDSDSSTGSDDKSPRYSKPKSSPEESKPRRLRKVSLSSDDSFSEASKSSRSRSRSRSPGTSSWESGTDISPLQSPDRAQTRGKSAKGRQYSDILKPMSKSRDSQVGQRHSRKDIRDVHQDDNLDLNHILEQILDLEAQQQRMPDVPPKARHRKQPNYSFTDSRIQSIEHNNQKLLQKILELQQSKLPKKKTGLPIGSLTRVHHTTINRQKEQRKIEQENMRIMRRLQSVKPTPGHSRGEQLSSYWRQATYGVPKFAINAADAPDPDDLYTTYHSSTVGRRRPTSAYSVQSKPRSRPTSGVAAGRARPWSATSNTSLRSAASGRSGVSFRTASSESSKVRLRPRSAKGGLQPTWDERW